VTKPGEDGVAELFRRAIEKRNRAIGKQRIGDLNNLFTWRYRGNRESYVFPDDDAGLEDLKILLHHYALNNPLAMPRIIARRGSTRQQPLGYWSRSKLFRKNGGTETVYDRFLL
jgi:hypothetical protein